MDITSRIFESISNGKAIKANGPVEHWLTTLATGFWGFDEGKENVWKELQQGDVLIFQAIPPNWEFVSRYKPSPKVSGFIGAGIVESISKKTEPRWLSEVIESLGSAPPKMWPNLVHFSDVLWFGDVGQIPAEAVQEMIEGCKEKQLDLSVHISDLAKNRLTLTDMKKAGFTFAPMGTGGRLKKNAANLAALFKSHAPLATYVSYRVGEQLVHSPQPTSLDISAYTCLGHVSPTKKKPLASAKGNVRKGSLRNKDYLQEAADNQRLGSLGERIVLQKERQRVSAELGESYVPQVTHVSLTEGDGAGYDIRTVRQCDTGIAEYFIEVKTTSGDANTAFFISENEVSFAAANADRYEVVRVHSLDQIKGEYLEYRLTGDELLGMTMTPVSYRVNVSIEPDRQEALEL